MQVVGFGGRISQCDIAEVILHFEKAASLDLDQFHLAAAGFNGDRGSRSVLEFCVAKPGFAVEVACSVDILEGDLAAALVESDICRIGLFKADIAKV